jgi:hypothetical protein
MTRGKMTYSRSRGLLTATAMLLLVVGATQAQDAPPPTDKQIKYSPPTSAYDPSGRSPFAGKLTPALAS